MQYCLFCNLCVEACRLIRCFCAQFQAEHDRREQIKGLYPPAGVRYRLPRQGRLIPPGLEPEVDAAAEAKRRKQIEAIKTALSRGRRVLAKYVNTEEDATMLAELLQADERRTSGRLDSG